MVALARTGGGRRGAIGGGRRAAAGRPTGVGRCAGAVLGVEAHFFEQLFHHRLEAAGADIFDFAIHLRRDAGDGADAVFGEADIDPLGTDQRAILFGQRCLGVRQDRHEVILGQAFQFDADRQAALQLGEQVAGLGDMERAGRDEQDMVGLHRAVFGGDRGPLDQGQQVALDAFAADAAAAHVADRDLVDLVEEDDAIGFGIRQRDAGDDRDGTCDPDGWTVLRTRAALRAWKQRADYWPPAVRWDEGRVEAPAD